MLFFFERIVFVFLVVGEIVVEEIEKTVDTNHVPDIEVTEKCQGKEDRVHLEFSVLDQFFYTECDQGQPHHGIDPHGVVLLDDRIATQRIECRENDD